MPTRNRPVTTGRKLVAEWSLPVRYALFHRDGRFYAEIREFPVALCDCNGFVVVPSREALHQLRGVDVYEARLGIRRGLHSIAGYQKCPAGREIDPA